MNLQPFREAMIVPVAGRKPKPEGQARNRNQPTHDWTEVVDQPFEGGPKLPKTQPNGMPWAACEACGRMEYEDGLIATGSADGGVELLSRRPTSPLARARECRTHRRGDARHLGR